MKPKYTLHHFLAIAGSSLLAVPSTQAANTGNAGGADNHITAPGLLPTLPIATTA